MICVLKDGTPRENAKLIDSSNVLLHIIFLICFSSTPSSLLIGISIDSYRHKMKICILLMCWRIVVRLKCHKEGKWQSLKMIWFDFFSRFRFVLFMLRLFSSFWFTLLWQIHVHSNSFNRTVIDIYMQQRINKCTKWELHTKNKRFKFKQIG